MGDRVPGKAKEAGSLAIYEMTRGAQLPGVVNGLQVGHVGSDALADAVLSAALDACPVLGLTEEDLKRVYVDHDNSCPHVAWKGDREVPCTCGGGEVEDRLLAALRPVERES